MKSNKIMKLYKYVSSFRDMNLIYLKNYLAQQVWLNPLKNLNDPFEGRFNFISSSPEYILNDTALFEKILEQHHANGEPNLTANELKERLNSAEFRKSLKESKKIIKDIFENHGALCLTTKNNSIPMWAYYADNHNGYCIEFELDFSHIQKISGMSKDEHSALISGIEMGHNILSFKFGNEPHEFALVKVRYSDMFPIVDFVEFLKLKDTYSRTEYAVKNSVGVKFIEWKPEDEIRFIVNSNSETCGVLNLKIYMPFLKVTGVVLGKNLETEKEKIIHDLSRENGIQLYQATCSESTYEITVEKIDNRSTSKILSRDDSVLLT